MAKSKTEEEVVSVSPIEQALANENITNKIIQQFKTNAAKFSISGIDDEAGYAKVAEAKRFGMKLRTTTVAICKKGREAAIKEQKDWIAKEKELVAMITEGEDPLAEKLKAVDDEKARILFEAAQKQKLPYRREELERIDVTMKDEDLLRLNDDQFNATFNDLKSKYLEEKEAKLHQEENRQRAVKEDREKAEREEFEKIRKQDEERMLGRKNRLMGMGFKEHNDGFRMELAETFFMSLTDIVMLEDKDFEEKATEFFYDIKKVSDKIAEQKAEEKAAADIAASKVREEAAKKEAQLNARKVKMAEIGMKQVGEEFNFINAQGKAVLNIPDSALLSDDVFATILKEAEQKIEGLKAEQVEVDRKADEKRRAIEKEVEEAARLEADAKKGDEPKLNDLLQELESIKTKYAFKSAKYKKLQAAINELLDKTINYAKDKK